MDYKTDLQLTGLFLAEQINNDIDLLRTKEFDTSRQEIRIRWVVQHFELPRPWAGVYKNLYEPASPSYRYLWF